MSIIPQEHIEADLELAYSRRVTATIDADGCAFSDLPESLRRLVRAAFDDGYHAGVIKDIDYAITITNVKLHA